MANPVPRESTSPRNWKGLDASFEPKKEYPDTITVAAATTIAHLRPHPMCTPDPPYLRS